MKYTCDQDCRSSCFLVETEAQPTKTIISASILFGLNLRANYKLKSWISINLFLLKHKQRENCLNYSVTLEAFLKFKYSFNK